VSHTVFVDGQEGTTGLRIHELLGARPDIALLRIDPDKRKDLTERKRLINAADVVFLCLPDAAAREAVALVENPSTCVIDASTAHRTDPGWAFGMPELGTPYRQAIRAGKRIANPGCHSTGFLLAVRPLVQAGFIPVGLQLSCFSITGYSGGGKKMIAAYEAAGPRWNAPRPYALGLTHKHLPEMQVHAGLKHPPVFVPVVGNFYNGMAVTVMLPLSDLHTGASPQALHAALSEAYADEPFVRVMPLGDPANLQDGSFDPEGSNHSNRVDLFVFGHAAQVALVARLDNLGKGASGAAVQAMNLHLGLAEGVGLAA
jgi:N-acetyl-gamma-glutamyl-phosphate reductase